MLIIGTCTSNGSSLLFRTLNYVGIFFASLIVSVSYFRDFSFFVGPLLFFIFSEADRMWLAAAAHERQLLHRGLIVGRVLDAESSVEEDKSMILQEITNLTP